MIITEPTIVPRPYITYETECRLLNILAHYNNHDFGYHEIQNGRKWIRHPFPYIPKREVYQQSIGHAFLNLPVKSMSCRVKFKNGLPVMIKQDASPQAALRCLYGYHRCL